MMLPVFHLSVFALYSYTIWYDHEYIEIPFPNKQIEELPLKARPLFLTMWCLVLQTLYFAISFLNDAIGTNAANPKKPPLIRRARDILFSLAFPIAVYVVLVFWAIYITRKDLIFPDEVEKQFPVWVNHVMHTLIVPFICIDMLVTSRNFPSRKFGLKVVVSFICIYVLWVLTVYLSTGIWAYPFLDFFSWTQRVVFFVATTLGLVCVYVLGEKLNNAVSSSAKVCANGVNGKTK